MSHFFNTGFVFVSEVQQFNDLNRQLAYCAEHSSFYRERLDLSFHIKDFVDLRRLPFTTPRDIHENASRMVCVPGSEVARIVSLPSSGTTGDSKRIYFTEGDLQRTVDFFAEGMKWMCGKGDRVGIFMPGASPNGISDLLARGLRKIGAEPIHYGLITDFAELLPKLREDMPRVLVGIPWQMRRLALCMPELRPRTVLLSADYTPKTLPALLNKIWGCRVLEHFGMTETGYGCAVEHPDFRGMFLRRDEFLAEVVDPESGKALPLGEMGELVITTLRREAMPLIRYRTGDWAYMHDPGRIGGICGRISQKRSTYERQDRLCSLPWLYEFRESVDTLCAIVSHDAPENCSDILRSRSGLEKIELSRLDSPESLGIDSNKRAFPTL